MGQSPGDSSSVSATLDQSPGASSPAPVVRLVAAAERPKVARGGVRAEAVPFFRPPPDAPVSLPEIPSFGVPQRPLGRAADPELAGSGVSADGGERPGRGKAKGRRRGRGKQTGPNRGGVSAEQVAVPKVQQIYIPATRPKARPKTGAKKGWQWRPKKGDKKDDGEPLVPKPLGSKGDPFGLFGHQSREENKGGGDGMRGGGEDQGWGGGGSQEHIAHSSEEAARGRVRVSADDNRSRQNRTQWGEARWQGGSGGKPGRQDGGRKRRHSAGRSNRQYADNRGGQGGGGKGGGGHYGGPGGGGKGGGGKGGGGKGSGGYGRHNSRASHYNASSSSDAPTTYQAGMVSAAAGSRVSADQNVVDPIPDCVVIMAACE